MPGQSRRTPRLSCHTAQSSCRTLGGSRRTALPSSSPHQRSSRTLLGTCWTELPSYKTPPPSAGKISCAGRRQAAFCRREVCVVRKAIACGWREASLRPVAASFARSGVSSARIGLCLARMHLANNTGNFFDNARPAASDPGNSSFDPRAFASNQRNPRYNPRASSTNRRQFSDDGT